jgi:hypothetical protein
MSGDAHHDIMYPTAVPFVLVHIGCLAAIWTGVTWQACVVLYWLRMFAIGAGYHRYFSHRSYSTSRIFQFLLAVLAQTTAQRASFGGQRSIGITISIPIRRRMSTPRCRVGFCTVTSAGFSQSATIPQI